MGIFPIPAMATPSFSFIVLAFSFALLHVTTAIAFISEGLEEVSFGYSGQQGPNNWGNLNPKYQQCVVGKSQSPISISTDHLLLNSTLKPLTRDYRPGKATLINRGFVVGVRFEEDVGSLAVDGKNYSLKQMHWHTPAEHVIDGNKYAAELHLVHIADDGNYTVVSILYQLGDPDPLLSKLTKGLDELGKDKCGRDEISQYNLGTIDTKLIKRNTRKYYRYLGSLTTPPCSEPVIWNILGKVRKVSKEQIAALKVPLNPECKNNARPQQHLNDRRVQLYDEIPNS